jgi:hypothetical protein
VVSLDAVLGALSSCPWLQQCSPPRDETASEYA